MSLKELLRCTRMNVFVTQKMLNISTNKTNEYQWNLGSRHVLSILVLDKNTCCLVHNPIILMLTSILYSLYVFWLQSKYISVVVLLLFRVPQWLILVAHTLSPFVHHCILYLLTNIRHYRILCLPASQVRHVAKILLFYLIHVFCYRMPSLCAEGHGT